MTDDEWVDEFYLPTLLRAYGPEGDLSPRKLRLFGTACCRRVIEYVPDPLFADTLDVCEQWAGDPFAPPMRAAERAVRVRTAGDDCWFEGDGLHAEWYFARAVEGLFTFYGSAEYVADNCRDALCGHDDFYAGRGEMLFQADLLRDIFGNPNHPAAFDPDWRTSAALGLAAAIFDARAFDRMPILADTLQDAGCEDAAILGHSRDPQQVHVRGCWVVDLVLGKG